MGRQRAAAAGPGRLPRPVGRRRAIRPSAIHLLVGDSIGRDSMLESWLRHDVVVNRCRGAQTSDDILKDIDHDINHWEMRAATEHLPLGCAVYWTTANDVYSKWTGSGVIDKAKNQLYGINIRKALQRLLTRTSTVIVLGPLPRLDGELPGVAWEKSAAFHLERTVKRMVEDLAEQQTDAKVVFVPLGRCITKKMGGRHSVRVECAEWYKRDWIHLNRSGYAKLTDAMHLPIWIRFGRE